MVRYKEAKPEAWGIVFEHVRFVHMFWTLVPELESIRMLTFDQSIDFSLKNPGKLKLTLIIAGRCESL